jgi:enoyl-CoA hydratase/carnithine racemase
MIQLTLDGGVARLVLDRPQVRNALAVEHWQALADAATHAAASGAHLLLLSGADGAFCAGADLSEFGEFQADESARARFRTAMRTGLEAVAALPLATIAWIDGPCFGAGVALAMAADIRIAAPTASFAITPAKIGIGYPQEDVARLVALVGPGWAARLLFTGDVIAAQTAERIGLVEEATDPAGCEALVQAVLACDTDSIAMLKRGITLARRNVASDADQDRRFDELMGSPALAERLSRRRATRPLPRSDA